MALVQIPVVGVFTYRDEASTPAAGEKIHFVPVSQAVVDGETVTLPKKLVCTLDEDGEVPADFTLPTVGDGVYYRVIEKFAGRRDAYTILVETTDVKIDLATLAPVVPPEDLLSTRGPPGPEGPPGAGLSILGELSDESELPLTGEPGDAYLIDGDLWVWGDSGWINAGSIQGPPGPGADLSDAAPQPLGVAAAGTSTEASRADHVHALPTATDVGADPVGTASSAMSAHTSAADPHPQYLKASDAAPVATSGAYSDLSGTPTLGTAASHAATDFATESQGAAADTALQPGDGLAALDSAASSKLGGIETGAQVNVNADWDAASGDAQILHKPTLGSAAAASTGDFDASGAAATAQSYAVQRANHTGTQAISTVSGLQDALDGKEPAQSAASQAEAEAGSETGIRKFSPLRIFQAIAAWWAASSAKAKLDGIATGATANASDAQLRDRATHTGTQAAATITGLATVATSGAYSDLAGKPMLGTAASRDVPSSGDASSSQVVLGNDSRLGGGGLADGDYGDVTVSGSGTAMAIDAKAVTYAKMQDISATARVLGRNSSGSGVTEEVTLSQLLDWVVGAADGDILYRSSGAWTRLGVGSDGQVLTLASGLPSWAAGGSGGAPSVRSASADAGSGSTYVYVGAADSGTLTSAGAWTITRLTVDGGGDLTVTEHATANPASVWDNYLSLTYA